MTGHPLTDPRGLLAPIALEYTTALRTHGPGPSAVFWRDARGQRLRFEQLIGIIAENDRSQTLVLNDLGCGYGALFDFVQGLPFMAAGRYHGYDICAEMVACAHERIRDARASFVHNLRATHRADYSFVSGTYNLRLDVPDDAWIAYVQASLIDLAAMSRRGLAFNMLARSRWGPRQTSLFYTRPEPFVDFCRRQLSSDVTLVTGYPLAEWTLWVRL